jgi:hypothetical protein
MDMRVVQFRSAQAARHLGVISDDGVRVYDVTSIQPGWTTVLAAAREALQRSTRLSTLLRESIKSTPPRTLDYAVLLAGNDPAGYRLCPPIDHPDPARLWITGTGLTHLGSMQSRDQMHAQLSAEDEAHKSDSKKMFELGLHGGRPDAGHRGVAPEWFFKGNGTLLRGPGDLLNVPAFALDGGEEPEVAGCYLIDDAGQPRRIGFALGNEWSDHATEKINYLYLAPSKLRPCAIGPELVLDWDFQHLELRCTVSRDGKQLYDSGPLFTGEQHMTHTLGNCEDHHFKYPHHRLPGDVHVHFFGTSQLSYGKRTWQYETGDVVEISAPGFSAPLVNQVTRDREHSGVPTVVTPL